MTPNIWLKSQGKTVFAPLSNAAWTPATRTLGIPTTTTRYPGTRIKIVHRLSAVGGSLLPSEEEYLRAGSRAVRA